MNRIEDWAKAIKKHEGYFPGSASYRNNNPGNFRCSPLIMGELGAIKCVKNLAVFPTYEKGWEALKQFLVYATTDKLKSYKSKMTLLEFYKVYAPSADGNNPLNYATAVAKDLGVAITTKISELNKGEAPAPEPEPAVSKFLAQPIDTVYYTQRFGERPLVYSRFGMKGHNGLDYRTRFWDSPFGNRYIVAGKEGKVIETKDEGTIGYGRYVRLEHDLDGSGNEQTIYGHLKKWYVKVGQSVKQGQRIGLSDNTGFSSGPHLHFGYRPKGWKKIYNNGFKGYVDPLPLIK